MASAEDALSTFKELTGCSEHQARHLLEACDGDVKRAVQLYYDTAGSPAGPEAPPAAASSSSSAPVPPPAMPAATTTALPEKKKKQDELFVGNGQAVMYGGQDEEEEGGGLHDMMEAAVKAGAVSKEEDMKRRGVFQGTGRRLGDAAPPPSSSNPNPVVEEVQVKVTKYKNGFTVDDGELRDPESPEGAAFLGDLLKRGQVPQCITAKLREQYSNQKKLPEVKFVLEDKGGEEYVQKFRAFTGQGRSLGGPAQEQQPPPPTLPSTSLHSVDDTQPTTTIQIQLPDGTRLPAKFNLSHTVGDIASFAKHSRPQLPQFTLVTAFPRQELTDYTLTIKDAGLARAAVRVVPSG